MDLSHLTDSELIEHVLKFDEDPVRRRLAKIMDEMPGFILQRLEDVGMDPETCMFENIYDPGDWIRHLENEIEYAQQEADEARERAARLESMTVLEFMDSLRHKLVKEAEINNRLMREISEVRNEHSEMKSKLSMWAKLNGDFSGKYKD